MNRIKYHLELWHLSATEKEQRDPPLYQDTIYLTLSLASMTSSERSCSGGVQRRDLKKYFSWNTLGCISLRLGSILISGIFKGLSTGSELQWGNWAAHEFQLQTAASPRRKNIFFKSLFCTLLILPRGLIARSAWLAIICTCICYFLKRRKVASLTGRLDIICICICIFVFVIFFFSWLLVASWSGWLAITLDHPHNWFPCHPTLLLWLQSILFEQFFEFVVLNTLLIRKLICILSKKNCHCCSTWSRFEIWENLLTITVRQQDWSKLCAKMCPKLS